MKTRFLECVAGLGLLAGLAWGLPACAAVSVYGLASSSGEFITVRAYANIATTPIVSYSAKLFYDPDVLSVVSATKNVAVWRLYDGVRAVPYANPDTSVPGQVLLVGAHLEAADPLGGVVGDAILLGTVVFGRRDKDTPKFDLTIGRTGDYASFVTTTGMILESLPGEVTFADVVPPRDDQDLDGLMDPWEITHFKDIRLAFYSDDPDQDRANNLAEQALGSDPNDPASNLSMTIRRRAEVVRLEWTSFAQRSYAIEVSEDLRGFQVLEAKLPATPPLNAFEFKAPDGVTSAFYRIRLEQ